MFIENVDILIIKTQKSACEQKKFTVKGWRMLCSGFKATFCFLQCVCKDVHGSHFVRDLISIVPKLTWIIIVLSE